MLDFEVSKSLEFKFNQIWLKWVLCFLIHIPLRDLKNFIEESCSLFNYLHLNILYEIFGVLEGILLIE
jgi:hypothetical protein